MKTSSAKAKGRRLQQHVAQRLRAVYQLPEEDVRSTSMGTQGCDIQLSAAALARIPFAIECKNVEALNVWKAFEQARENARSAASPMLVISRNRTEPLVVLDFEDFLRLWPARAY